MRFAFFRTQDKTVRAKLAVLEGINLVLELPFPYSSNTAEIFAKSGVHIASSIGADYLIFGSECGDIGTISKAAEIMMSDKFSDLYECLKNHKSNKSRKNHAKIRKKPRNFIKFLTNLKLLYII